MGLKRIFLSVALTFGAQTAVGDTGWFLHEFNELRAYHGDFLNVCYDAGQGPCRVVQYAYDPGPKDRFFGDARLALHRGDDGVWRAEIYDKHLPFDVSVPFELAVDGQPLNIPPEAWSDVTPDGIRVAQTLSLTDPELSKDLNTALRRGFVLTVTHEAGQVDFSLRGLIAAQTAIDDHLERMRR